MNNTLIRLFTTAHMSKHTVLSDPRPVIEQRKKLKRTSGPLDCQAIHVKTFTSKHSPRAYHPGFLTLCRINVELLLAENLKDYWFYRPKYRTTLRNRSLDETDFNILLLLNAPPFILHAANFYLPKLECLACNNYLPMPYKVSPKSDPTRVTVNYRSAPLFLNTFPDVAFPCAHHDPKQGCKKFYVDARLVEGDKLRIRQRLEGLPASYLRYRLSMIWRRLQDASVTT